MTVVVPGVGVITKKSRCKQFLIPLEIPAARFSCLTSGSFRPKLGLCILLIILTGCVCLIVLPLFATSYGRFSVFLSSPESKPYPNKMEGMELEYRTAVREVAEANNKFNAKLYEQVARGNNGNVILSPFSVESVMSMVLSGAKEETANQIRSGLCLPEDEDLHPGLNEILEVLNEGERIHKELTNFTLKAANRLYTQEGFALQPDFLEINKKHYFAEPQSVNFREEEKARGVINNWVEEQTKEKIKDLIPSGAITSDTRLVLVNALYFKGDWDNKFDTKATLKQDFYTGSGKTVKVDMMHKKAEYSICAVDGIMDLDSVAIEIPYKDGRLSMILILPNTKDGLLKLEENYDTLTFGGMGGISFHNQRDVEVAIPKFKAESTHDLKEPLKNLGLENMFDVNKADFSGITGRKDLFVSKVIQKVFIEVNEEGSEAAAATGVLMLTKGIVRDPKFICDHPFLFMIIDNFTGVILFSGKVTDPTM